MRRFMAVALLAFVAVAAWRITGRLSADAVSMAVGVLFGVAAGVPAALLVLASSRRRDRGRDDEFEETERGRAGRHPGAAYGGYFPQPPVIVVTGGQPIQHAAPASYGRQAALPAPYGATVDAREFKVVGEREGWIDEW